MTIFIIIGLVLVLSVAVYFFIRTAGEDFSFTPGKQKSQIEIYVGTCLDEVSRDAMQHVGKRSGYYYIPHEIYSNPFNHLSYDKFGIRILPFW